MSASPSGRRGAPETERSGRNVLWGAKLLAVPPTPDRIWTYCHRTTDYCVPLHDDSQACIRIAGNPCLAERTKHFDVKYHWLREKIKANKVELRYVNTHEQLADIFTKPLGVMQHNYLKGRLTGFR